MDTTVFEQLESQVRSYCRSWPVVFSKARGARLWDEDGRSYLDFFSGAGALNYGHNHPELKRPLLEYLADDNVVHSLDTMTVAKRRFMERFRDVVLAPRELPYKVLFPGPTGTNAVEAALKVARKATGREQIISFTNAFHGMTLGSLAVTGNSMKRGGAGVSLQHSARMPFCNYLDEGSSLDLLEALLADSGSGVDLPAAVIVETVQGEGGLNVATMSWLRRLADICKSHGMLLIVDDIQMGIGRTGPFFSFEPAGIVPDIVTLSKSLSGYGLPLSLTLLKPEHDQFEPGEHNGTFRGHNPAFVTGAASLSFWEDGSLERQIGASSEHLDNALMSIAATVDGADVKGRGLARGISFDDPALASATVTAAFERGLMVETTGAESEVVKLFPPINVSREELDEGIAIMGDAVDAVANAVPSKQARS